MPKEIIDLLESETPCRCGSKLFNLQTNIDEDRFATGGSLRVRGICTACPSKTKFYKTKGEAKTAMNIRRKKYGQATQAS